MYFAERYDEDIFDELITDYVPALADHPGWQGVTFSHTLNMATGTEGSEGAEHLYEILILASTAEEAINNIASLGDYPEAPGETFVYASTNLLVLSFAKLCRKKRRQENRLLGFGPRKRFDTDRRGVLHITAYAFLGWRADRF